MPKDDFDSVQSLPLFLADRTEQRGIGNARDGAIASSRVFTASIVIAIATAAGIAAALLVADPVALVADVTASLVGNSELQPGTDQSTPAIQLTTDASASVQSATDAPALVQSAADAQASPPIANEAPTRNEVADAEPAAKDQAEKNEASSEDLFRQFQAWAAAQDPQPGVKPGEPAQDAPAQVAKNAPSQAAENDGATQKRRHIRATHNARAEMRTQNFRKTVHRTRRARVERSPTQAERRPVQDARAQDQAVQDAQASSFLPIFGLRN